MRAADGIEVDNRPHEAAGSVSYLKPAGVGLLSWVGEGVAVTYCLSTASTHLIDEGAKVVLSAFSDGTVRSPSEFVMSFPSGSPEDDAAMEARVGSAMRALARVGLLRKSA
jgi:hypothetical protein